MMWDNKHFIATNRGWRNNSKMVDKTERLQGDKEHSPQDLVETWAMVLYVSDYIVSPFSKTMAKYSCWKARATWALASCSHETGPWAAPLLSREASRGPLAVPTHLPLLFHCSSAYDSSSLLTATDTSWAMPPLKRLLHQLRSCLLGCLKSATIIPATLGKSPGCELLMLKMENQGQCSYYNFLNSKCL